MSRIILVIAIIFCVFFAVTALLNKLYINKKYIKYLPSIISLILGLIYIYLSRQVKGEGFKDLGRALMGFLFLIGFVSGLLSGLYFDFIHLKLIRKRKS